MCSQAKDRGNSKEIFHPGPSRNRTLSSQKQNNAMLCHYIHPTCSFQRVKDGYSYFPSTLCKETCVISTVDCNRTFEFLHTSYEINKYCPRFNFTSTAHRLPACHEFPEKKYAIHSKMFKYETVR